MLCDSCLKIFSHRDYLRPFLVWPPKSTSSVFLQMLGAIFWSQTTVDAIFEFLGFCQDISGFCPDISGFCPDFQGFCQKFLGFCPDIRQIKTFGGALAPPAPPPPTPLSKGFQMHRSVQKFSFLKIKWNISLWGRRFESVLKYLFYTLLKHFSVYTKFPQLNFAPSFVYIGMLYSSVNLPRHVLHCLFVFVFDFQLLLFLTLRKKW